MFRVNHKEVFAPDTFLWQVVAPEIARAGKPGQFVMVRLKEGGERIPLTLADFDPGRGIVTLVVKVVGKTTEEMSTFPEGALFADLVGPLGVPSRIEKKKNVVVIGGGLGVAPAYPIVRGFKEVGSGTTTIIGFRNKAQKFWEERFLKVSDRLIVMTDDGSYGKKGTTLQALQELLAANESIDEVLAIGPLPMMAAIADATRGAKIPTYASMNSIMVDGIGMCGSCRVKVGNEVLFACVDGPDMDAHRIDFKELQVRQTRFYREEQAVLQRYREECALKKRGII